jgi:hypothetical protein
MNFSLFYAGFRAIVMEQEHGTNHGIGIAPQLRGFAVPPY